MTPLQNPKCPTPFVSKRSGDKMNGCFKNFTSPPFLSPEALPKRGCGRGEIIAVFLFFLALLTSPLHAEPSDLVADISHHLIAIHTDFKGMDVVLFGSVENSAHIVVTVRGPNKNYFVQKKEKKAGIWVNRTGVRYYDVPSFFRVAADQPLEDILSPSTIHRHQLSPKTFDIDASKDFLSAKYRLYKEALIDRLEEMNLYDHDVERVRFLGPRLFRSILHFPSNIPPGIYQVHVYEIRDGEVVAAQSIPLNVNKVGLSSDLWSMAKEEPILYGLMAVLGALLIGLLGGYVLRRGRH